MQHARDGRVVEVAARTRTIPPALRRALQQRDRGCRFRDRDPGTDDSRLAAEMFGIRNDPLAAGYYGHAMRSVADALRIEDRVALASLSDAERVALALRLGARDLERFRSAQTPPLSPADADRRLRRQRQQGRRLSQCMRELIG
jgi:hypothetical protein